MLTPPTHFANEGMLHEATKKFEDRVKEICQSYHAPAVLSAFKTSKDLSTFGYGIVSLGAWVKHSNEYDATNAILAAWDEMFGINGFF